MKENKSFEQVLKEIQLITPEAEKVTESTLKWLEENYIEDRKLIVELLTESVIKSAATISDLMTSLSEIKQLYPDRDILGYELKKLQELANRGITGKKAAKALIEGRRIYE